MVRDPDRLLDELSRAVSDGESVDWAHATGDIDDQATRAVLDELRVLADIARLHRDTLPEPGDHAVTVLDLPVEEKQWGRLTLRGVIGRGARGIVYRAWDPQLDREVALKLIADRDEHRTEHDVITEARLLARVQHPHVATVYGADRRSDAVGLWMELVDGQTLEAMLRDGCFNAREAALIGVDVCSALAAVHRAGLLHRDVKAQNVMRDRHGRIVLMDFGTGRDALPSGGQFVTDQVGTPLYMAPELFQGAKASVQSDIYSVGVLLYRLVTGGVPIDADSPDALRAAHQQGSRRQLSDARGDLPLAFIHLVERAMAADPAARYPTAGALEMALSQLLVPTDQAPAAARPWRRLGVAAALAVTSLAVGGGLAYWWQRVPVAPAGEVRFGLYPQADHEIESLALSPDGRYVAYTSAGQLWLRPVDRVDALALAGTAGARDPFWSPDSTWVAFFKGVSVWRVAAAGGEPQLLAPARRPSSGTWGADDTLLYSVDIGKTIVAVPATGGEPRVVRRQQARVRAAMWWPSFLSDGRHFIYSAVSGATPRRALFMGRVDDEEGTDDRELLQSDTNAVVAGDRIYYVRLGQLVVQHIDPVRGVHGVPLPLADHVRTDPYGLGAAEIAASAAGPLGFLTSAPATRELQVVDREGRVLQALSPASDSRDIRLSPDGSRLAFEDLDAESGTRDIWILDMARRSRARLTQHPADDTAPVWSPDGTVVYFLSYRDQRQALYRRDVDSGSLETHVFDFPAAARPYDITPDGATLLYELLDQDDGWDLWTRPLAGGAPVPYMHSSFNEHDPAVSPDGRFVAYSSPDSGGRQIYVAVLPTDGRRWRVSTDYGREPLWSRDGRRLYYHGKDRMLMEAPVELRGIAPVIGTPQPVFQLRFRGYDVRYHYAPLPDGRRFVLNAPVVGSASVPATIVLNPVLP